MNATRTTAGLLLALLVATDPGGETVAEEPADGRRPVLAVTPRGVDREARQPQVAVGPGGRAYIAYGAGDLVRCVATADGGRTWGEPSTVGTPGVLALGKRRGPRIAATADAVVVTAIGGENGGGRDGDLWAWRSTDGGTSWSDPVRVNDVAGSAREGLHAMAAGPDGTIFCAWVDLRDDRAEVRGAASRDGGQTWEPDLLVHRSPEGPICPCCHPSVAFSPDGTLSVMWRDAIDKARDMYLARSTDGGRTFSAAEKLGLGTWPLEICPMDGGSIAAGPDGVVTTWMRDGRTYLAAPGEPERPLGPGVQSWAAWGPGGPFVAWLSSRPGPLLVRLPGDDEPMTLARSANDPCVAAPIGATGPVIAAWEPGPGGAGLFAARLDAGSDGE